MTLTVPIPTTDLSIDEIRLGELDAWIRPDREGIFAKLRAEAPITFQAEPVPPPEFDFPQGPGFWALTRYADVMQVSRDPDTFHSAPSINIGDIPAEIAEWLGSMINMDAPKHTKLRLIVNRGFTPRQVARIDDNVREQAREIVDHVITLGGECDFVSEIAAVLPLQIICDMLGHPAFGHPAHLRAHEHDPRSGRPGVRADARGAHGRGHGAVPVRPRPRAGPARQPARRHHHHADAGRGGRRERAPQAHTGRVGLVLPAPRRGRQRDDTHRDQSRHARAHASPRPAHALDRRPRSACRRPRSRRSSAGPRP